MPNKLNDYLYEPQILRYDAITTIADLNFYTTYVRIITYLELSTMFHVKHCQQSPSSCKLLGRKFYILAKTDKEHQLRNENLKLSTQCFT